MCARVGLMFTNRVFVLVRCASTGGDLRYYLDTNGAMKEDLAQFYAAEMICGLEDLHSLRVVWRCVMC